MAMKSNKKNSLSEPEFNKLKDRVSQFLNRHSAKAFTNGQIIRKLDLQDKRTKDALSLVLTELSKEGKAQWVANSRIRTSEKPKTVVGKVDFVNPRFAFVVREEAEEDVYVREDDLMQSLDDDLVEVTITGVARNGKLEGKVTKLLERKRTEFVGKLIQNRGINFVRPDFRKMFYDIHIDKKDLNKAKDGQKVIVQLTDWPYWEKNPNGKITRILGQAGENEAEIHSIMAEFGLPFEFPARVEEEAEQIPENISNKELENRRDFRKVCTFTIDPEDAKDFDDAISIEKLENGQWQIGVHIADVTHYVQANSQLEKEALHRATSVYLVDRTIPMLPERLSNGLCSLRPKEEKLTFSAVFEMDEKGRVLNDWFGRTIIYSDRRFTYEEAQERIETFKGDFAKEINILNDLAKKLKAERFKNGAIAFETVEVKFKLDEKGKPLGVVPKHRKDAHKLVEEFMLLANRKVAEFVYGHKKRADKNTFVYRTHDNPNPEKLDSFSAFAARFGHKLEVDPSRISNSLNKLMESIEGKPEQNVLESLAIRSMAKAKYTTDPKGHFGLAFKHYTHFTSPIRRYPDMMVHRLLQQYLDDRNAPEKEEYEPKCLHSSEMEKRAADAERASIKYKQVEYMAMFEKQDFEGVVSGVMEWGIFVEIIETKCEGMVRISDMKDDWYEFDEENYRVIGRNRKRIIQLGDKVMVKVVGTDIDRRTIDLEFVWGNTSKELPTSKRR
jgi:ribonuclease R